MKGKYKLTGLSRFLIFVLFFAPFCFGAAAFLNGENPVDLIKEKIQFENFVDTNRWDKQELSSRSVASLHVTIDTQQEFIDDLQTKIEMKDAEINALKEVLADQKEDSTSAETADN